MADIELAEMIKALRCELAKAQEEGDGEDIRFLVGDVELELTVSVAEDLNAKLGVKFLVAFAEAGAKHADQTTHKIKLKLTPCEIGEDGKPKLGPVLVSDSSTEKPEY